MSIAKKYNIPEETVTRMVKEGVISCSVSEHYRVFEYFQQYKASNPHLTFYQLCEDVGDKFKRTGDSVKKIYYALR